jgi:hypothetical protein
MRLERKLRGDGERRRRGKEPNHIYSNYAFL